MTEKQRPNILSVGKVRRDIQRVQVRDGDTELYTDEKELLETTDTQKEGELTAEEVEERRVLPTPILPSQTEVDHHWLDHLPFRSWCNICIQGRGRERPHLRTHGSKRRIPTLAFDYCFVSKEGTFSRE